MSARPHTPPRRIFRSRRGRTLVITDQPGAAYHAKVIKAGLKLAPGLARFRLPRSGITPGVPSLETKALAPARPTISMS